MPVGFRTCLAGLVIAACVAACPAFSAAAAPTTTPAYADPAQTDDDFPFQGEYAGTLTKGGTSEKYGVLIHENAAIPKITPGGPQQTEQPTGPLHLQNHGNPVRYRNIWVQPKS